MVPIFKRGPRYIPGNYRLVNLTSIVCKLMEGVAKGLQYIQDFCNKNGIISDNPPRFMKNRSCQNNLLTFYEEVSYHLDKRKACGWHFIQYPTNVYFTNRDLSAWTIG